jgi:hypothetical protein
MGKRLAAHNGLSTKRDLSGITVSSRKWFEYRVRFVWENG